jgi:porin
MASKGAVSQHARLAIGVALLSCLAPGGAGPARADDGDLSAESLWTSAHLIPDWRGLRAGLEESGIRFDVAYTGDFVSNTRGGLKRENEYLGNLDMTFTWHTEPLLGCDLGTFFLYGLLDHGGHPSADVGDAQGVDNIEAPSTAKLFEAWWQQSLLDDRASVLVGLYDVNSEFYAVDSAELFLNSSFGIGAELGTSGVNGPSIFPTTSLGIRLKAEPIPGYEIQAAVLDGIPGDPNHPKGTRIDLDHRDGVFFITEVAYDLTRSGDGKGFGAEVREDGDDGGDDGTSRRTQRRRVGREWSERPTSARVALGTWLYSTRMPHLGRTNGVGDPVDTHGHPGLYLIADYDATQLDPLDSRGLAVFVQLGWADGDVAQFEGYTGAGFTYKGLIPLRPEDELGMGVAAAYNGNAFKRAARADGDRPAVAEVAVEWTYQAILTPWLSLQGDLQYVVNPDGLRNRRDALVAALRYVIDF